MAIKPNSIALRKIKASIGQFLDESLREGVVAVLPENLTKDYLLEHKLLGLSDEKWLGVTYHLVHSICVLSMDKNHKRNTRSSAGWVPLSSSVLREIGGRAYKDIRLRLVEIGVIECDKKYSRSKKEALGYRLGKAYRAQRFKYRPIPDTGVAKALFEQRRARLQEMKPRILGLAHLVRWVVENKLLLDKEAAYDYLAQNRELMLQRTQELELTSVQTKRAHSLIRNQYHRAQHRVEWWGKDISLSVDDKGGRLYTPVVTLMSPLRHFLTYGERRLVSFDIKNSQPLHFLFMMQNDFLLKSSRSRYSLKQQDEDLWGRIKGVSSRLREKEGRKRRWKEEEHKKSDSPINLHLNGECVDDESIANTHFANLALTGNLYEFIRDNFRGKYKTVDGRDRFDTREKAKTEMLQMMYFDPSQKYSPAHDTFREFSGLFPREAQLMESLKSRSYKDFPVLLQRLEAQVLLHNVCRKIYDYDPSIPLFTVHDSVVTTEEYADFVGEVIHTTYTELLGVSPTLDRVGLKPTSAFANIDKYVLKKLGEEFDVSVLPTRTSSLL